MEFYPDESWGPTPGFGSYVQEPNYGNLGNGAYEAEMGRLFRKAARDNYLDNLAKGHNTTTFSGYDPMRSGGGVTPDFALQERVAKGEMDPRAKREMYEQLGNVIGSSLGMATGPQQSFAIDYSLFPTQIGAFDPFAHLT